jgi:ABC-2 type transport system ATP-binding protein
LILKVDKKSEATALLKEQGLKKIKSVAGALVAPVETDFDVAKLNAILVKKKIGVSELRLEHPSLEEYFVDLTGEGFEVVR